MASKIIELEDGSLIEVDAPGHSDEQIAWGLPDKVESSIDRIKPIIIKALDPIISTLNELSYNIEMEQAHIELGLSFEAEGNIYITKAKGGANLKIGITLRPKPKS